MISTSARIPIYTLGRAGNPGHLTRSTTVAFLLALSVAMPDEPAEVTMPKDGCVTMAS